MFTLLNGVIVGGQSGSAATNTATETANVATSGGGLFGGSSMGMVVYIVFLIAIFYFLAIKPQKKRERQMNELQSSIKVGDWVLTSSGLYGKVVDITKEVFIIEFGVNKGVSIPVIKSQIIGNKEPNLSAQQDISIEENK